MRNGSWDQVGLGGVRRTGNMDQTGRAATTGGHFRIAGHEPGRGVVRARPRQSRLPTPDSRLLTPAAWGKRTLAAARHGQSRQECLLHIACRRWLWLAIGSATKGPPENATLQNVRHSVGIGLDGRVSASLGGWRHDLGRRSAEALWVELAQFDLLGVLRTVWCRDHAAGSFAGGKRSRDESHQVQAPDSRLRELGARGLWQRLAIGRADKNVYPTLPAGISPDSRLPTPDSRLLIRRAGEGGCHRRRDGV